MEHLVLWDFSSPSGLHYSMDNLDAALGEPGRSGVPHRFRSRAALWRAGNRRAALWHRFTFNRAGHVRSSANVLNPSVWQSALPVSHTRSVPALRYPSSLEPRRCVRTSPRQVGPKTLLVCRGQPAGHRLRRVTRDRRHDQTYELPAKYTSRRVRMSSASLRFPDTHASKVVDRHASDQAAESRNLTRVRLPQCCGPVLADVGLTARDSGGKLTFYGRDPIVPSSFRVWRHGRGRPGCQSIGAAALWKSHWRRTGHSCRRAESSPALLWFLRRQVGNDQRT